MSCLYFLFLFLLDIFPVSLWTLRQSEIYKKTKSTVTSSWAAALVCYPKVFKLWPSKSARGFHIVLQGESACSLSLFSFSTKSSSKEEHRILQITAVTLFCRLSPPLDMVTVTCWTHSDYPPLTGAAQNWCCVLFMLSCQVVSSFTILGTNEVHCTYCLMGLVCQASTVQLFSSLCTQIGLLLLFRHLVSHCSYTNSVTTEVLSYISSDLK